MWATSARAGSDWSGTESEFEYAWLEWERVDIVVIVGRPYTRSENKKIHFQTII